MQERGFTIKWNNDYKAFKAASAQREQIEGQNTMCPAQVGSVVYIFNLQVAACYSFNILITLLLQDNSLARKYLDLDRAQGAIWILFIGGYD